MRWQIPLAVTALALVPLIAINVLLDGTTRFVVGFGYAAVGFFVVRFLARRFADRNADPS